MFFPLQSKLKEKKVSKAGGGGGGGGEEFRKRYTHSRVIIFVIAGVTAGKTIFENGHARIESIDRTVRRRIHIRIHDQHQRGNVAIAFAEIRFAVRGIGR